MSWPHLKFFRVSEDDSLGSIERIKHERETDGSKYGKTISTVGLSQLKTGTKVVSVICRSPSDFYYLYQISDSNMSHVYVLVISFWQFSFVNQYLSWI